MAQTKMVSYSSWRDKLARKGFSDFELFSEESFQRLSRHADVLILEKQDQTGFQEMTPEMFFFKKLKKKKPEDKLINELKDLCKKQEIFRKNKVEDIRQRIQNKTYKIPGKSVVEKWFPEDPES